MNKVVWICREENGAFLSTECGPVSDLTAKATRKEAEQWVRERITSGKAKGFIIDDAFDEETAFGEFDFCVTMIKNPDEYGESYDIRATQYIVEGFSDAIMTVAERDKRLKELWSEFGDIPMNPELETIESEFLHFPVGTDKEDIWHWFDERHSKGVFYLLYGGDKSIGQIENLVCRKCGAWLITTVEDGRRIVSSDYRGSDVCRDCEVE